MVSGGACPGGSLEVGYRTGKSDQTDDKGILYSQ